MDYHGTSNGDNLDQAQLGLPDWVTIYGGAGNDTIRIGNATAIGEVGDDTIIGTTSNSTVAYLNSPSGVSVNLATGVVSDGFGGTDQLSGIRVVQGTGFSDVYIGSSADETFWLSGGNDTVRGGGGNDTVIYYGQKSSDVSIHYDAPTDTFTVTKNFPYDRGTDTISGVSTISFQGNGSDETRFSKNMFADIGGFHFSPLSITSNAVEQVSQLRPGDFNGDGIVDFLYSSINWSDLGVSPVPLHVYLGDGKGGFIDGTEKVFSAGIPYVHYVPRIFTADFNHDGISDVFCPDFGVDAPPFPGGQNSLFLSSPTTHLLDNITSTFPQELRLSHGTSIGDVNGDGYADVLVNALDDVKGPADQLFINDGSGHLVVSPSLMPASSHVNDGSDTHTWSLLADLNNDGYDDIALGTWPSNPNPSQILLNNGHGDFSHATAINLPRSGVAQEVVVGMQTIDLNGDALPDLILDVTNGTEDHPYQLPYLQLLVNDGAGHFHDETQARLPQSTSGQSGSSPDWYMSTTIVDLNRDGFQDIVVDDAGGGQSKTFLNDGHGRFQLSWQSAIGSHITVADVDRDGMLDLIESNGSTFAVEYNKMANAHIYLAPSAGETVVGSATQDLLHGVLNGAIIDGAGGLDTVVYQGTHSALSIKQSNSSFTIGKINDSAHTDTLSNIERVQFDDVDVALDITGVAGQAYRIYQAAFNRTPDEAGLGYWINAMDQGASLHDVAQGFVNSNEFSTIYGAAPSNSDILNHFYQNVLHRAGDPSGFAWWLDKLDTKAASISDVLAGFSESAENQAALIGQIGNGIAYAPYGT